MANVKKTSATTQSSTVKKGWKVSERHELMFLSSNSRKKNVNGTEFISTPRGAVYANLNKIESNRLYRIVTLRDGDDSMLALHQATSPDDVLEFVNEKMNQFPNMSAESIRAQYGI